MRLIVFQLARLSQQETTKTIAATIRYCLLDPVKTKSRVVDVREEHVLEPRQISTQYKTHLLVSMKELKIMNENGGNGIMNQMRSTAHACSTICRFEKHPRTRCVTASFRLLIFRPTEHATKFYCVFVEKRKRFVIK